MKLKHFLENNKKKKKIRKNISKKNNLQLKIKPRTKKKNKMIFFIQINHITNSF